MAHQAASRITITTLPTDVLSCIVRHIQENALQRDQRLDDIAALRSTCRSLRNAVDATVTSATFHPNLEVAELRSTIHRCSGECICFTLYSGRSGVANRESRPALHVAHSASDGRLQGVAQTPADCNTAGLHTIKLQQLHPDATAATAEALATLQSLRTIDMP